MSNVIPFGPNAAGTAADTTGHPPHIDEVSFGLLASVVRDLHAYRKNEPDQARAAQLRKAITRLNSLLARFEPPQGAA